MVYGLDGLNGFNVIGRPEKNWFCVGDAFHSQVYWHFQVRMLTLTTPLAPPSRRSLYVIVGTLMFMPLGQL